MNLTKGFGSTRSRIAVVVLAGVLIVLGAIAWLRPEAPLASDPHRPRPWAEERFLKLTKPVPSTAGPLDPRFAMPCDPLVLMSRGYETTFDPPRDEYVPDLEVVEFDAAKGFTGKNFKGAVRLLGTKTHLPDPTREWNAPVMDLFRGDGTPIPAADEAAMGIESRDHQSWGGWSEGVTCLNVSIGLDGGENPQARVREVFDFDTHIPFGGSSNVRMNGGEIRFGTMFNMYHDAHLLAVVDLAHGPTREQVFPLKKGAVLEDPAFRLEILEILNGSICGSSTDHSRPMRRVRHYDMPRIEKKPSFSVIYRIDPPVMEAAVSLEALDAQGQSMGDEGRFMQEIPVSKFQGDLAQAVSLRIRYRPHMTRLLVHLDPLPGMDAGNVAATDLFDVRAPDHTFRDFFEMRQFIADMTQLKHVATNGRDDPASFPLQMARPSAREVVERYCMLAGNRKVEIDPVAMTVGFEPAVKQRNWTRNAVDWLRRYGLWP